MPKPQKNLMHLNNYRLCRYAMPALATVWVHVLNYFEKLGLPACCQWVLSEQLMVFSLLGHLIIVEYSVFKYLRFTLELEEIQGPPGPQLQISSKEAWKKHTFFGWKHTLFGRWEGGGGPSKSLNQKNLPRVVFAIPGPPWYWLMSS